MTEVLRIEHLNKRLGKRQILHDISFSTYGGEVFGFLGPNGAGKTTTIKIAVGLLTLDEGEITICGASLRKEFEKAMSQVGGIVENPEFYAYMSGYDNLKQYAAMRRGVTEERIREVVHLVGLDNRIHEKVGKYSLGMRQRLGVAQSILHHPKLLVLDEPTNGLDPAGIKDLRDTLKRLAHEEDVSVLVSSHLMSEMELMCDRVGVIANGAICSVQPIKDLVAAVSPDSVDFVLRVDDADRAIAALDGILEPDAMRASSEDTLEIILPKEGGDEALAQVNRTLIQSGVSLYTVNQKQDRKLEDVFLELIGEGGGQIA